MNHAGVVVIAQPDMVNTNKLLRAIVFLQINHIAQCHSFFYNRSRIIVSEEVCNPVRIGIATRLIKPKR